MVSSHAIHYGNEKTLVELLRIRPEEHERGPVSMQLFGQDPDVMRSAAATVAAAWRRPDRPQHGLPGPEGLQDRRGRGADRGSRHGRRGRAGRARGERPAGHREAALGPARRRPGRRRAGAAPRRRGGRQRDRLPSALGAGPSQGHARLRPRRGARREPARSRDPVRRPAHAAGTPCAPTSTPAPRRSCSRAARSGNPWMFAPGARDAATASPSHEEILDELDWVIERAVEHLGSAARGPLPAQVLPWYLERLGAGKTAQQAFQQHRVRRRRRARSMGPLEPLTAAA